MRQKIWAFVLAWAAWGVGLAVFGNFSVRAWLVGAGFAIGITLLAPNQSTGDEAASSNS